MLRTLQRPNILCQLLHLAPDPRHGMMIIHLQHSSRLRTKVRLRLLDTHMKERVAQTMDMQRGQGYRVIPYLLVNIYPG